MKANSKAREVHLVACYKLQQCDSKYMRKGLNRNVDEKRPPLEKIWQIELDEGMKDKQI